MFKSNKNLISKIIARFFIVILIAFVPIVWIIQNDSRTQNFIQKKVIEILEKEWDAKVNVKSSHINIFTGKISIEDGLIHSKKGRDFCWKFKTAVARFSRLKCFLSRKIFLKVELSEVSAETLIEDKKPLIVDHLENIFATNPDLPAALHAVKIRNLNIKGFLKKDLDVINEVRADFLGELFYKKNKQNCLLGKILLEDGILFFNEKEALTSIKCDLNFKTTGTDSFFIVNSNKSFKFCNKDYFIDLVILGDKNNIDFKNTDNSLALNLNNQVKNTDYKITGTFPIDIMRDICSFYSDEKSEDGLSDLIKLDLLFSTSNNLKLNGNISAFDIVLNLRSLWDLSKNNGKIFISNEQDVNFKNSNYLLKANGFKSVVSFNDKFYAKGKYKIDFSQKETKKKYQFSGDYFYKNKKVKISGKTLDSSYLAKASFKDQFYLSKFLYLNRDGQTLLEFVTPKDKIESKPLKGKIKYSLIRDFLPYQLQKNLVGRQAYFEVDLDQSNLKKLKGSFKLANGKLSFLGVYNPIQNIKSNFFVDLPLKKIALDNLEIDFFKGSINTVSANIGFDNNYKLSAIEFPVQINNLLVNWNRDFYGIICGDLFLNKKLESENSEKSLYKLLGSVFLKKSLIKNDTFSDSSTGGGMFSESFFVDDKILEIDVNFLCDRPLRLRTKFLTTDAFLDLNIKTMYADSGFLVPKITGDINLEKGYLNFLKNKLYIDYATVQFLPTQPNEPIIDLLAKNKIKKYLVTLQVTGALSKPRIVLDSSPDLREEEILSLLFAGSETASLQYDFPAMIMQNLEDFIKSEKIFNQTTSIFKKIILPFKYIQITPDFSSQTGRGGVKGTVSIDLNKQMHAQIQKNFNLQDDLAFQIEYFLTDDINLKMVKDQRGDVGAEVEVRLRL